MATLNLGPRPEIIQPFGRYVATTIAVPATRRSGGGCNQAGGRVAYHLKFIISQV